MRGGCKIGGILQAEMQPHPLPPSPMRRRGNRESQVIAGEGGAERELCPLRLSFFCFFLFRATGF